MPQQARERIRVRVRKPDGATGTIDISEMDVAKEAGWEVMPAPGPPLEEFFGGLREMSIPRWEDIKTLMTRPQEIPGALREAQLEQAKKAREAETASEVIGRSTAAAVPLLGPAAAIAGETIGSGNVARGLGQTVGLLAPFGVAKVLKGVRPVKPVGKVPLLRGERAEAAFRSTVQRISGSLEASIAGSGPFTRFRETQQAAIQGLATEITDKISKFKGDREVLRLLIQDDVKNAREALRTAYLEAKGDVIAVAKTKRVIVTKTKEVPSRLVGPQGEALTFPKEIRIIVEEGGIKVPTASMKAFARQVWRQVRRQERLGMVEPTDIEQLNKIIDKVLNAGDSIPFDVAESDRTTLLAQTRRITDPLPARAQAGLKQQEKRITDAMRQALSEQAGPDIAASWDKARRLWQEGSERLNSAVIKKLVDISPERAGVMLLTDTVTLDDIAYLKKTLSGTTWQAMKRDAVSSLVAEAMEGELQPIKGGLGTPRAPVVLRGAALERSLEMLQKRGKLHGIFTADEVTQLVELASTAKAITDKTGQGLAMGLINLSLLTGGIAAVGAGATGRFTTAFGILAGVIGEAATVNVAARVATSPQGLRLVRELARGFGQGAIPTGVTKQLSNLIAEEVKGEMQKQGIDMGALEQTSPQYPKVEQGKETSLLREVQRGRSNLTDVMLAAKQGEIEPSAPRRIERALHRLAPPPMPV